MAPPELMAGLRRICDEHGIVLIADEVQTGFGRTGKMFAMEHYAVEARSDLRGEKPRRRLPAVGRDRPRRRSWTRPSRAASGGTYAGNPLACAAALAVLDVFEEGEAGRPRQRARRAAEGAAGDDPRSPIRPCRSPRSAALGRWSPSTSSRSAARKSPTPPRPSASSPSATELGLILLSCGVNANTIRILTPLTAPDAVVDEGLERLEAALQA